MRSPLPSLYAVRQRTAWCGPFCRLPSSRSSSLIGRATVSDLRDANIEAKEAIRELMKLVRSRLGLELPEDAGLTKLRSVTLRYVLAGEFRSDLSCVPPASLDAVPAPKTKDDEAAVRDLARRLRTSFSEVYPALADRVQDELGLSNAKLQAECLGSIDTFRFEEKRPSHALQCARRREKVRRRAAAGGPARAQLLA
jgi:hypothetical protein